MSDGDTIAGQLNAAIARAGAAENALDEAREELAALRVLRRFGEFALAPGKALSTKDRELVKWAVASTQAYSDAGKYDAGRDMTPRCIEAQLAAERIFAELDALRAAAKVLIDTDARRCGRAGVREAVLALGAVVRGS